MANQFAFFKQFEENPFLFVGVAVATSAAIPAVITLAPVAIAGLGVAGGVLALTALGAGFIATTAVIGKHIDEAIEAHNSHHKIKKILDDDSNTFTPEEKITKITKIVDNKKNNLFLKLYNQLPGNEASKEVSDLYLGALYSKEATGEIETVKNAKILNGLRIVNKVDDFSKTQKDNFLQILRNFKRANPDILTYKEVGQKITEHSDSIRPLLHDKTKNVFHYFKTLQEEIKKAALGKASRVVNACTNRSFDGGAQAFYIANQVEADREDKIWNDFYSCNTSQEDLLSAAYQYKLKMGLNILESTRSESCKINELDKLMRVIEQNASLETFGDKALSFVTQFTEIDASPPTGDIAKDTPWPKALRVFAKAILEDTTDGITDKKKLLALKSYLKELENPNEFVKEIQDLSHTYPEESIIKECAQIFLKAFNLDDQYGYFTQQTLTYIKTITKPSIANAAAAVGGTGPTPGSAGAGGGRTTAADAAAVAGAATIKTEKPHAGINQIFTGILKNADDQISSSIFCCLRPKTIASATPARSLATSSASAAASDPAAVTGRQ